MRDWLTNARTDAGLSTVSVAYHMQVCEAAVRQWERGVRTPSRSHQLRLASLLGRPELAAWFDAELTSAHHQAAFMAQGA